jgi:hypothetical protein
MEEPEPAPHERHGPVPVLQVERSGPIHRYVNTTMLSSMTSTWSCAMPSYLGNAFLLARLISRSRGRTEEWGEGGSEGNRTFVSCRRFRNLSLHFCHNLKRIYWRWNGGGAARGEARDGIKIDASVIYSASRATCYAGLLSR